MPAHTPGAPASLLVVEKSIFATLLPCTLLGSSLPTDRLIPTNLLANDPDTVHLAPPAFGALPPITFPLMSKLPPAGSLTLIPCTVTPAVVVRTTVW
jgi:hypothetical protein